ncbi:MAG TPA: hypothetical protein PLI61_13070 [bacterium]|nr:hypothetical protein [bacterium]
MVDTILFWLALNIDVFKVLLCIVVFGFIWLQKAIEFLIIAEHILQPINSYFIWGNR